MAVRASGKLVAKISNMLSKSPDKTYVRKRKMIELNTPDEAKKKHAQMVILKLQYALSDLLTIFEFISR